MLYPILFKGKWGYMVADGSMVIPPRFDAATFFTENLALVKHQGKVGFIDASGTFVIDPVFHDALPFNQGFAAAQKQGVEGIFWGLMDKSGEPVMAFDNEFVGGVFEGFVRVCRSGKWGYTNPLGHKLIDFQYDWCGDFCSGIARAQQLGQRLETFYIGSEGKRVFDQTFPNGEDFSEQRAAVFDGSRWAFITHTGDMICDYTYADVGDFSEGLCPVSIDTKSWTYIQTDGRQGIEKTFDFAGEFSDGLARVRVGREWGFIDREGRFAIAPQFEFAEDFMEDLAPVTIRGQMTYVHRDGRVLAFGISSDK